MIILHVKIIAFQLSLFCKNFAFQKLYKQKNTWMLGNTRFISRVEHDISLVRCARSWDIMFNTRNKFGIAAHPCIILYIIKTQVVTFIILIRRHLKSTYLCRRIKLINMYMHKLYIWLITYSVYSAWQIKTNFC
jgi:hypothetical protein